jgi:hypothetical protein
VLSYVISTSEHVVLKLYDVEGREVRTLVNERQPAGTHRIEMSGRGLPSGAYFYQLATGAGVQQKKMLVLR